MLVAACLRGDLLAFDELVERYETPLFNAAYRITGSIDDAMDATQTAFVRAFEKLHTFNPDYRFFSWIYRIVINQSLNLVGRRRDESALDHELPAAAGDPEAALDDSERARSLQAALLELGPEQRLVILLKHLEGFSYQEISELLGIPVKTVKSRLFTARQRLRLILNQRGVTP
ncbi:MAG TPA: sigma-70 family RNA polymerase sigma factor [Candidatus Sulfomarinibacteraceae bacterium]|nr:sigma-70 family RNA polymerase sigma factor [Candidatus Sulfomarinibacteraceae bacterium]